MSKTRPACRPHRLTPGGGGGGYLFAGPDRVNRRFGKDFHQFGEQFQGAKTAPGRRETTLIRQKRFD